MTFQTDNIIQHQQRRSHATQHFPLPPLHIHTRMEKYSFMKQPCSTSALTSLLPHPPCSLSALHVLLQGKVRTSAMVQQTSNYSQTHSQPCGQTQKEIPPKLFRHSDVTKQSFCFECRGCGRGAGEGGGGVTPD